MAHVTPLAASWCLVRCPGIVVITEASEPIHTRDTDKVAKGRHTLIPCRAMLVCPFD